MPPGRTDARYLHAAGDGTGERGEKGLWGWAVVDRGGPYAQGDRWLDDVFERVREAGIPAYLDDWPQTLPENSP